MMKFLRLILFVGLTGCVGPLVPVIDLDREARLRLRETIDIYSYDDLLWENIYGITHSRLGTIEATSCMNDPPASLADAIDQLRYRSSMLGGNGLTNTLCEGPEGTHLANNCRASVTCHAVAIAVDPGTSSRGTAFAVNRQGHLLTNQHVVDDCQEISAQIGGKLHEVVVLREDARNDLALLSANPKPTHALSFHTGERLRVGESVIALGFPLSGLLSSEPHVTTGTITALAGLGDDTRSLETSTPVQPGDSGSPLLNQTGNVVGVIVASLDRAQAALAWGVAIGDISQNINFARKARIAEAFLDANGVSYSLSRSTVIRSTADIAESAKSAIAFLECRRGSTRHGEEADSKGRWE